MPKPVKSQTEASQSLDARLNAAEAARAKEMSGDAYRAMGQGYRFMAEVVGGVLGGAGFGWLLDRFAGTGPFGLVGGLLIGTGLSLFVAVRGAAKASKIEMAKLGPLPNVSDDEDED